MDKIYYNENGTRKEAKGEELEYIKNWQAEAQEAERLLEAEQQAKEAARESAMAKLKALGLTDNEIAALVP